MTRGVIGAFAAALSACATALVGSGTPAQWLSPCLQRLPSHREPVVRPAQSGPVVRELTGVIEPATGQWTGSVAFGVEVMPLSGKPEVRAVISGPQGQFTFPSSEPGTYCYRVTTGMESIIGVVTVSRRAAPDAMLRIPLRPGSYFNEFLMSPVEAPPPNIPSTRERTQP